MLSEGKKRPSNSRFGPVVIRVRLRRVFLAGVTVLAAGIPFAVGMAEPSASAATTTVPCNTSSLITDIADAASGDTLNLATGCTYTLSTVNNSTDGPTGLPVIAITLTLNGNGATIARSTASGTPDFRIFDVAANIGNLTINGLTITNGIANSSGYGGGIYSQGTLTVNNSTISANNAFQGGGIFIIGPLQVGASTISNNTAFAGGGGVYVYEGIFGLTESTVTGNTATEDNGGGIYNYDGQLQVTDSTLSGNTASSGGDGGAIFNSNHLTVTTSTIDGNTAYQGSGIYNYNTATVESSTVSGNTTTAGDAIANRFALTLAADIIAKQNADGDCVNIGSAAITDAGYNIDDDGSCNLSPSDGSVSDSTVIDDYLGNLGSNGGPTETVPLLATASPTTVSTDPAFQVIPATFDLPVGFNNVSAACSFPDQRGVTRGQPCDIGAFELQLNTQTIGFSGPGSGTVGASATLSATGGASGSAVVFSVDPKSVTGVCNVSGTNGTTVNYTAAGNCVIDANQAGNANYAAAPQVQQTITVVTPKVKSQRITFGTLVNKTLAQSPVTVSASSSSGLAVTFTTTTSRVCTSSGTNGATIILVKTGRCTCKPAKQGIPPIPRLRR